MALPSRRAMTTVVHAQTFRPLVLRDVLEDEDWKVKGQEWEGLFRDGNWARLEQEFMAGVKPILERIKLQEPVSDLHSPDRSRTNGAAPKSLDWVDLVLSGGGILGYAHVGYVLALESVGIRFRGIGGASAGSIVAFILAAVRPAPDAAAAGKLLRLMLQMPASSFADGKAPEKALTSVVLGILKGTYVSVLDWVRLVLLPALLIRLFKNTGLHPGNTFEDWMVKVMEDNGAGTLGQLKAKCDLSNIEWEQPAVNAVAGKQPQLEGVVLCVAADISTSTRAVLSWERPLDKYRSPISHSELYWENPDQENPAHCVRASMAVPVFFWPKYLPNGEGRKLPNAGLSAEELPATKWGKVGYDAIVPDQACFVDGGVLSNFPVNLFHVPAGTEVRCPTFGANLRPPRTPNKTRNIVRYLASMLRTALRISDYEFIGENEDYKLLTQMIDTGGVNGFDFGITMLGKYVLFHNGVLAAHDFLMGNPSTKKKGFDWKNYKKVRQDATKTASAPSNMQETEKEARLAVS